MGKVWFILGAAVGLVVGSRAGRGQYEKLRAKAADVWRSDAVQGASTRAATALQDVNPTVGKVAAKAKDSVDDAAADVATGSADASI